MNKLLLIILTITGFAQANFYIKFLGKDAQDMLSKQPNDAVMQFFSGKDVYDLIKSGDNNLPKDRNFQISSIKKIMVDKEKLLEIDKAIEIQIMDPISKSKVDLINACFTRGKWEGEKVKDGHLYVFEYDKQNRKWKLLYHKLYEKSAAQEEKEK